MWCLTLIQIGADNDSNNICHRIWKSIIASMNTEDVEKRFYSGRFGMPLTAVSPTYFFNSVFLNFILAQLCLTGFLALWVTIEV